jgi:DHA2 family multidrug resistance protein
MPQENEQTLNKGLLTILVMMAAIMQTIDSTIANVALPRMQGSLAATQDQIAWVLTSYIVSAAIMTPLTGWLSGRFGRKNVFLISVAGFTVTSALCGLSENIGEAVFFRMLQGLSGAALIPLSQAVLFDINPPEKVGSAMALWGVGVTMGPIIGPVVGGWLTDNYNWRWVFYINVPIGIFLFIGLSSIMPDTKKTDGRFDFFGFITLSLSIGAMQIMLDRGERQDWFSSSEIITECIVMCIAFYLFLVHMLTYSRPFLSPELFKDRNFVMANVFMFLIGVVLFATLALLPPMLENQLNYPVFTTGLVTAPRGAGTMCGMIVVGRLIGRIDTRLIIAVGLSLTALSLWQMTHFDLLMDYHIVVESGFVQGLGIGLSFVPLSVVAFGTLPSELRNEGTSFFNLVRNVGSSVGISVLIAILTRKTQIFHSYLAEHITPYNASKVASLTANLPTETGYALLNANLSNQAAMLAYINNFKLMMVITIAVIPLLLIFKDQKRTPSPTEVVGVE